MDTTFHPPKNRHQLLVWVLTCLFSVSCANYRYFPLSYHDVESLDSTAVTMYLIDNEHVLSNVWAIKKYTFKKDDISCTLENVPKNLAVDIVQTISKEDFEANKNQVLLFAKPELTKKLPQTGSVTFDYHELDHIQVVEKDHKTTFSNVILFTIAFLGMWGLALRYGYLHFVSG
jgi:hypothetical protein